MSYATIDNLLSASPTGSYLPIFTTFDTVGNTSVYNANLWGGGGATLNWTGITWADDGVGGYAAIANAVAITKRHVLCTNHGGHDVGVNVTFLKADGTRVVRNLESWVHGIGGEDPSGFRVLYMDSDLPSGIAIYPILGSTAGVVGSPAIKLDNEDKALIANVYSVDSSTFTLTSPLSGTRFTYYEDSVLGDSGSPMFMLLGTQLIYATSTVGGGGGSGPLVSDYIPGIQAACTALDAAGDHTGYEPIFLCRPCGAGSVSLALGVGL